MGGTMSPSVDPGQCTKSTVAPPPAVRYARSTHGPGINAWVFESRGARARAPAVVGGGLEFAVQLAGEVFHDGHVSGARRYGAGEIVPAFPGELYTHSYGATRDGRALAPTVQVGFVVFDDALAALVGPEAARDLFVPGAPRTDARMLEFAHYVHGASLRGDSPRDDEVRAEVAAFVARCGAITRVDRLARARHELERYFACDLPLAMIAETASLSEVALARGFKRRFGATPAHYRVLYRLNQALRLLWMRPELSVEAIGSATGFANKTWFHRAFVRQFGRTPALMRGT